MSNCAELHVNMQHVKKWKVTECNVKQYNHIVLNNGVVFTLDKRQYIEYLLEFNIFFTCK